MPLRTFALPTRTTHPDQAGAEKWRHGACRTPLARTAMAGPPAHNCSVAMAASTLTAVRRAASSAVTETARTSARRP